MAFWIRVKESQIRVLSNGLKRCYHQTHNPSKLHPCGAVSHTTLRHLKPIQTNRGEFLNSLRFFAAPVQVSQKKEEKDTDGFRLNEKVTAPFVRLVSDEGHAVVSRFEALDRAKSLNLDLVEVDRRANPPVCKLMDYHKETYLKQAREKEQAKKKSDSTLKKGGSKEVRFLCKIEKKDLKTKADTIKRMMDKGYRVKCMAVSNGSETENLGEALSRLSSLIEDVALVESGPHVEKKQAYIVVRHAKFGPLKKGSQKKAVSKVDDTSSSSLSDDGEDMTGEGEQSVSAEGRSVIRQPPSGSDSVSFQAPVEKENRYRREPPPPPPVENRYRREPPGPPPPPPVENRYRRETTPPPGSSSSSPPTIENRYKRGSAPAASWRAAPPGGGEERNNSNRREPPPPPQFSGFTDSRRSPPSGYGSFHLPKPESAPGKENVASGGLTNRYKQERR
ncbi:unnamed protein product [Cuscuta campestris]|uniref:Translation initiation factor 3 N-terminal domain-containing protein n=1 Tax=Cuscuta campestris TaxID=132261 RepID=A0A484KJH9_9ASTE|nr:unnamed protein product [Cuscuta campestris]